MLYDQKWQQETKANPFTLESLIAWLEKQPADTTYCFWDYSGHCLLSSYLSAMGRNPNPSRRDYVLVSRLDRRASDDIGGQIALAQPWTYGAALERARALQAKP